MKKTIVITGATSGIGLSAARMLAALGHRIIIGARDAKRGNEVVAGIVADGGEAELLVIDMASFASIRAAARSLLDRPQAIDVLVNNAGVVESKRTVTSDGYETTWATNFLAPFLFTDLLRPALERSEAPRVVNVSSTAYKIGKITWDDLQRANGRFSGFSTYAMSKLALTMYTREFARRVPGIPAYSVHPGGIGTRIWRNLKPLTRNIILRILPGPDVGARPIVRLVTATDLAGLEGHYFDKMREQPIIAKGTDDAANARLWEIAAQSVDV